MGRTHLLAGACVALTVFFYLGCASKPREGAQRQGGAQAVAEGDREKLQTPGRDGAAAGPRNAPGVSAAEAAPELVARHAGAYAENLESLLARRRATARPPAEVEMPVRLEPTPASPAPEESAGGANAAIQVAPAVPEQSAAAPAQQAAATDASRARPQPPEAKVAPKGEEDVPAPSTLALPTARSLTQMPAPAPAPAPAPTTDEMFRKLAAQVRNYPRDTAAQLDYQLLKFLREEPVPELGDIAGLPAEDRELLTALIDGLSNFRSALRSDMNMLQSKKVSPLLEMGNRLRGQGELTLPTAVLCTRVDRFGVYEPMEPAQFRAGAPNQAVLYCEVANFSSQIGDNRQWETRLKHESVLYSETGLAVWQDKTEPVTDTSRNRRQDFYVVKRLRVPPMPVGRYLLKVTVTDLQVNRVAEKTVPIQVVAPER